MVEQQREILRMDADELANAYQRHLRETDDGSHPTRRWLVSNQGGGWLVVRRYMDTGNGRRIRTTEARAALIGATQPSSAAEVTNG